ncbi:hypothetical protein JXM67_04540 [candidate division WOR-3 bacterium]|nr:hypothetical protein [candidate division WOR-3 bacterium]
MKHLLKQLFLLTLLSSPFLSCDLFSPRAYSQDLVPIDSLTVFHNLINSYNTLDYEIFTLCLDSQTFRFIPKDTTIDIEYEPWGYGDETSLTYDMFQALGSNHRIPPVILQVDTSFFSANDIQGYIHANYLLMTCVDQYETLAGGFELKILKRGNYWYLSEWKEVPAETLYIYHPPQENDTIEPIDTIDTIIPPQTEHDWSDLKVYFKTEF